MPTTRRAAANSRGSGGPLLDSTNTHARDLAQQQSLEQTPAGKPLSPLKEVLLVASEERHRESENGRCFRNQDQEELVEMGVRASPELSAACRFTGLGWGDFTRPQRSDGHDQVLMSQKAPTASGSKACSAFERCNSSEFQNELPLPWDSSSSGSAPLEKSSGAAVYQRRKRDPSKPVANNAKQTLAKKGMPSEQQELPCRSSIFSVPKMQARSRRQRASWLGRCLSRRRSSIIAREIMLLPAECTAESASEASESEDEFAELDTPHSSRVPGHAQRKAGRHHESRPLRPLPEAFVQRQQSFFAEVDDFKLEEESPGASQPLDEESTWDPLEETVIDVRRPWRPREAAIAEAEEDQIDSPVQDKPSSSRAGEQLQTATRRGSLRAALALTGSRREGTITSSESAITSGKSRVTVSQAPMRKGRVKEVPAPRRLFEDPDLAAELAVLDLSDSPSISAPPGESAAQKSELQEEDLSSVQHSVEDISQEADCTASIKEVEAEAGCKAHFRRESAAEVLTVATDKLSTEAVKRASSVSCAELCKSPIEATSPLEALLQECGQASPATLEDFLSTYCGVSTVVKLGEGTYGEAFRGAGKCFKIVPMEGTTKVNGELQKTAVEMYSEVLLTNTLSALRGPGAGCGSEEQLPANTCEGFIKTHSVGICKGRYAPDLIRSWEEWDTENTSQNDHPLIFPENQLYVVFVFADGGIDLERFVLKSFEEARSLLAQVVLTLAVAEQACGFEHRDLHWGNILLARNDSRSQRFRLQGEDVELATGGLTVALIDFTLSRLEAGGRVLFCDLAADPELFKGPVGDVQADTYRRMKKVARGHWEKRLLQTNSLWLHYLVDILLTRKSFPCSSEEKHELKGLRKRVLSCKSSGEVLKDEFFAGLLGGARVS